MKSYRPEIRIKIDDEDRTALLGDTGSVKLSKSLYAPMGQVNIDFPDMPAVSEKSVVLESLYGKVPVLAKLEIQMRRWRDGEKLPEWTTVLRGFVKAIARDEQVGGDGRVHRQVSIVGQDCGAAFVMEQFYRQVNWQDQGFATSDKTVFYDWQKRFDIVQTPMPAGDFLWDIASKTTKSILEAAKWEFERVFSVQRGWVFPLIAMQSEEGPIWSVLKRYSDAPWNEFFVREGEKKPELVYRPTPWTDIDGNPLPDADMKAAARWPVAMSDVVSLSAQREDTELINHAWVTSALYSLTNTIANTDHSITVPKPDTRAQFGDRFQQFQTYHQPSKALQNAPAGDYQAAASDLNEWVAERLKWVVQVHSQYHEFESGSIVMKGDPRIRVGDYIDVQRGALSWSAYVVGVSHDFQPYRHYFTHIQYDRSNQWVRRQKAKNPWTDERKTSNA